MHRFNVIIEAVVHVHVTPGKPTELECSPEILEVFQPVPVDVTRINRIVIAIDEQCRGRNRKSSQDLCKLPA